MTCGEIWEPCSAMCRGYQIDLHHPNGPSVIGCGACGVPDYIARTWSAAHNLLAKELIAKTDKLEATANLFPVQARKRAGGK